MLQMLWEVWQDVAGQLVEQCMGQPKADTSKRHRASRITSSMQQVLAERSSETSLKLGTQQVSTVHPGGESHPHAISTQQLRLTVRWPT